MKSISQDETLQGLLEDEQNCKFFIKTGACKYGNCCQRKHPNVVVSKTIVIYGMFVDKTLEKLPAMSTPSLNPCMKVTRRKTIPDDEDLEEDLQVQADIKNEYRRCQEESNRNFRTFYEDVYPEFAKFGELEMFKCCNNLSPHLRGNVYIQFRRKEDCIRCVAKMNGRYYAGRPLAMHYLSLTDWTTAICAYNGKGKCPKLLDCNFLHVYPNPRNAFPVQQRTEQRRRSRSRS